MLSSGISGSRTPLRINTERIRATSLYRSRCVRWLNKKTRLPSNNILLPITEFANSLLPRCSRFWPDTLALSSQGECWHVIVFVSGRSRGVPFLIGLAKYRIIFRAEGFAGFLSFCISDRYPYLIVFQAWSQAFVSLERTIYSTID